MGLGLPTFGNPVVPDIVVSENSIIVERKYRSRSPLMRDEEEETKPNMSPNKHNEEKQEFQNQTEEPEVKTPAAAEKLPTPKMRTKFTKETITRDSDVPTIEPEKEKATLYSSETFTKSTKPSIYDNPIDSDKWKRRSQYKSEDESSEDENEKGNIEHFI